MDPSQPLIAARRFHVGGVIVDTASRVVTVDGAVQPVELKPLSMFMALLDRAGEALSRAELKIAAWGDETVNEGSLDEAMSRLRRRLSPYGRDIIVRALVGGASGYRIGLPVKTWITESTPRLRVQFAPGDRVPARPDWRLGCALDAAGLVWRAIHDADGRAAVFVFADTPDGAGLLRRQVACAGQLQAALGVTNGWLPVLDSDLETWPPFLVRPFVQTSLAAFSADHRLPALTLDARVAIVAQLARCVGRAHAVGIVHGAIRPETIFLEVSAAGDAQPQLGGFVGAVEQRRPDGGARAAINRSPYLAPEDDGSLPPTAQGDVYALGMLLLQLVTASCATRLGADGMADVAEHLLRGDIAAAAAADPARRLGSASDLARRLERLAERRAAVAQGDREAHRLQQRARLAQHARRLGVMGALMLVLVGIAVLAIRDSRRAASAQQARVAQISELVRVSDAGLIDTIARRLGMAEGAPLPVLFALLDGAQTTLQGLIRLAPHDAQLLRLEARGLTEFARSYFHQGAVMQARDAAGHAQAIQRALLRGRPDDAGLLADLADSERWTGEVDLEQHDFHGALAVDQDVVRVVDRLIALGSPSAELDTRLGRALDAVGFVQMQSGDATQALATFRSAHAALESAATRSHDVTVWLSDLAINEQRTGDALDGIGDYHGALGAYQMSVGMFRQLVALDGSNVRWRRAVMASTEDIGDEQSRMKDFRAALASYLGPLESTRQLAAADPTNAQLQRDLAVSYTEIGDAKGSLGDNPGATSAYRSAETVFAALTAHAPDDISLKHDFVATEMNLADSLDKIGDKAGAYPYAADALRRARGLAAAQPGDRDMVELVRLANGVVRHLGFARAP